MRDVVSNLPRASNVDDKGQKQLVNKREATVSDEGDVSDNDVID